MPLQNLYTKSPMEEYSALPWGVRWGMGQAGAQEYRNRQKERDTLVDLYNQQVVNEYNPQEILRLNLDNAQKAYQMPTFELQGAEAQAKLNNSEFIPSAINSTIAKNKADTASNENVYAAQKAEAPYVTTVAANTAASKDDIARLERLAIALQNPVIKNAPDDQIIAYFKQRFTPEIAAKVEAGIKKHTWAKYNPMFQEGIQKYLHNVATSDVDFIQKYLLAQEGRSPSSKPAIIQLAESLAGLEGKPVNFNHFKSASGLLNPIPPETITTKALVPGKNPDGSPTVFQITNREYPGKAGHATRQPPPNSVRSKDKNGNIVYVAPDGAVYDPSGNYIAPDGSVYDLSGNLLQPATKKK